MSTIRVRLAVVTIVMAALPGLVLARGGGAGGSGPAMSVYGPVYNPAMSREYRLWAASPGAYQQMMMMRQQQFLMKQQQAYIKQMKLQQRQFDKWVKAQKARKDKGLATDPLYDQLLRMQEAAEPAFAPNGDPTVAPGGGPRPPVARKSASRKSATRKGASTKAKDAESAEDP
jgi:hypothetical protein